MNQFAGYSSIEIYNPAEGWHFNLKVYDKPIESLDYGFSLTTEDGSELWFYHVTVHGPEGIEHQPEISWMANLVKLTTPQDDGWGRFRFGETVIVNQTPYWSGTRYITGGENGWQFHMGPSTDITEYAMSFAGSRVVNGVQWNFYTYCGFLREGSGKEIDGVYHPTKIYLTRIFAVPEQEDICLYVELEQNYNYEDGILALPEYAFFSRAEYDACLDANIGSIIDTIVSQGLSNFYPYSE